jgi:hypothetical protein
MATTIIRTNTISGTSYTIDVTSLELDSNITIRDFIVSHNGINVTASYTKTSPTLLSYSGTNVTLGTMVNVERDTSLSTAETTFLSTTTAADLSNALNKLRKRVEEADAYATYVSNQLQAGGITMGTIPIVDTPYGAGWNGDGLNAPSRNAVYDQMQLKTDLTLHNSDLALKAPLASPAFTGTPTVPTPAYGVSDTQAINRAYAAGMTSTITNAVTPALVLTTTMQTVQTVPFTVAANNKVLMVWVWMRIFNTTATATSCEVFLQLDGVTIASGVFHLHGTGTGIEHSMLAMSTIRTAVAAGSRSLTVTARVLAAPSGRVETCEINGLLLY